MQLFIIIYNSANLESKNTIVNIVFNFKYSTICNNNTIF